jgi:multidrug efflux system outer membrane protein
MRKIIVVALLPLFLAGCTVGPKYVRPAVQPPANFYAEQQAAANSAADMAWWDLFKDPILQDLIREALKNNYDLQLAMARVEQERALLGVGRSQYYPQVAYGVSEN